MDPYRLFVWQIPIVEAPIKIGGEDGPLLLIYRVGPLRRVGRVFEPLQIRLPDGVSGGQKTVQFKAQIERGVGQQDLLQGHLRDVRHLFGKRELQLEEVFRQFHMMSPVMRTWGAATYSGGRGADRVVP